MKSAPFWPLFAIVVLLGSLSPGCREQTSNPVRQGTGEATGQDSGRLQIVCTTTMIEDLARNLVGDKADVYGIMRAGEDPHVYDVRPRDAEQIADADLILTNGFHLEATLEKVIQNNARGTVVALAEKAVSKPLTGIDGAAPDPHCWMNVAYFRGYLQHALEAVSSADPGNALDYQKNAASYDAQLAALNDWVKSQIASVPKQQRVMVTSHDAFNYLADAYDIEVLAIVGISTAQAPRPQEIERIEAVIRDRNVRALFVETSVSFTLNMLVKKSAAATGVKIGGTLYSDSLDEPGQPAGSYLGMMNHNVSTIVDALQGS